jgi:hypothetical protein
MSNGNFKVALGPMSAEIVLAAFRYSDRNQVPLALIATKNQIDYCGGYVENWTTEQFMDLVGKLRELYGKADITVCRDHCGPGFNGNHDPEDVRRTIADDIRCGVDLIHIDFCKVRAPREQQIKAALYHIKYAQDLNPDMRFEIGTDEIDAGPLDTDQLRRDLDQFLAVCKPEFYVVNTGSHTMENRQVGTFDAGIAYSAGLILDEYGLKLKEHNADYLTPEQIQERRGFVDAVNIAPELGVAQTRKTLALAGVALEAAIFENTVYHGEKWRKWLLPEHRVLSRAAIEMDVNLCIEAGGHYHFASEEYRNLRDMVGRDNLIEVAMEIIDRYVTNLE